MIEIKRTTSEDKDFKSLILELDTDLSARYHKLDYKYDLNIDVTNLNTVVLAKMEGITVGCGCFKEIDSKTVEIKRIFVNPYFRSFGVSTAIMNEILDWIKESDYKTALLETGKMQPEAIKFFNKHGFSKTENFDPYIGLENSYCMSKTI